MVVDQKRIEEIKREINNPHDKLFKRTMGKPENMRIFLAKKLPRLKLENIKIETLRITGETYVDTELVKRFTDAVFEVELKDSGRIGLVSLLFEHKSTVVIETPLQILRYMVNLWYEKIKEGKIPLVLPVVFYHGEEEWTAPKRFSALLVDDYCWTRDTFPDFQYHFFTLKDLADSLEDVDLPELKLYVEVLRLSQKRKKDQQVLYYKRFDMFLSKVRQFAHDDWEWETVGRVACIYVITTAPMEEAKMIAERLIGEIPTRKEDIMSAIEVFKEEGRKEGRKEGVVYLLIQLMEQKSIFLSPKVKIELEGVDIETLERIKDSFFKIQKEEDLKRLLP